LCSLFGTSFLGNRLITASHGLWSRQ
jgi:hypothetical protein